MYIQHFHNSLNGICKDTQKARHNTQTNKKLFENLLQLRVAELGYPALAGGDCHVGKVLLLLYHPVYLLFETLLGDEAVHDDVLVLPDAVGAVGRLSLYGGVPPEVVVYHMARRSEVEPRAASLDGEDEDVARGVVLELLDHLLPLLGAAAAMQEQRLLANGIVYELHQQVAHLPKLRED